MQDVLKFADYVCLSDICERRNDLAKVVERKIAVI